MSWTDILQSVMTALVIAGIFAFFRLFRDVDNLKTTVRPVVDWYIKTSMDAMKIATNPTNERLAELADRYIANVKGDRRKPPLTVQEKDELIRGLREIMNDPAQYAAKRQSASMSLRFIETREGLTARNY